MKRRIIKTLFKSLLIIFVVILLFNCEKSNCPYNLKTPCEETCLLFDDFEGEEPGASSGNWKTLDATLSFQMRNNSITLYALDAEGSSWVYNDIDFPTDLVKAGCELHYDVDYLSGHIANADTAKVSFSIYQGTNPENFVSRASFRHNPSYYIISGAGPMNLKIPLELAVGTTLPSNSYGFWVLFGVTVPLTTANIDEFNTLIQNIDGIAFFLDAGDSASEEWWYDNFCFYQCCK